MIIELTIPSGGVVGGSALLVALVALYFTWRARRQLPTSKLETWLAVCARVEALEQVHTDLNDRFTHFAKRTSVRDAREKQQEQNTNLDEAMAVTTRILGRAPVPGDMGSDQRVALESAAPVTPKLALYRKAFPNGETKHGIP
jgi:uncharacterized protein (DUF3820 family)